MDSYHKQLKIFHPVKSARIAAGLLVHPNFHANTLRIEAFVHYCLGNFNGTKVPTNNIVKTWLNNFPPISSLSRLEDPIEDVFITKVLTEQGDFRIYEGIWEANDFHLQKVLDTIKTIPNHFKTSSLFRPIYSLLRLSEEVATRNEALLFQIANSRPKIEIQTPRKDVMKRLAKSLCFKRIHLEKMGLELDELTTFFLPSLSRENLNQQQFGYTDLERHPLVFQDGEIILMLPTAVSVAIRRFIFEWIIQNSLRDNFEYTFASQFIIFLKETRIMGNPLPFNLPLYPKKICGAYFFETIAEIEKGRYLQVIARVDTLDKFFEEGLNVPAPNSQEQMDEVIRRVEVAKKKFSNSSNYREGLSIVVCCGYGRPFLGRMPKETPDWKIGFIPAHDLEILGWVPGVPDKAIWKLLNQQKILEQNNIEFLNLNGLLNLYGWWEENDFLLVPDEVELGNDHWVINIPSDCLANVRQKTRNANNVHTENYIDGTKIRVRRKSLSSFFLDVQNEPLYACYEKRHQDALLGCAVISSTPIWVRLDMHRSKLDWNIQFQIWDCTHNWIERIGKALVKKNPHFLLEPLLISLDLSSLSEDDHLPDSQPPPSANLLDLSVSKNQNTIELQLQEPFLYHLHSPKNKSEKALVYACLKGIVDIMELSIKEKAKASEFGWIEG